MTTKDRREQDREKMRRRILDAARQLFVKEGFDNVSLRRIASRIEYSPAALYRYFRNKREILSALREEGFARFVERQKRTRRRFPDPLDRLRAGAREYIGFALSEPDHYHLMFSTSCGQVDLDGEWAASSLRSYGMFRDLVVECAATGRFGDVEPDALVFALWGQLHGLVHLIATGQMAALSNGADLDVLLDRIIGFGLRPGQDNQQPRSER
ncbi:putative HTH-type transcriptional regulator [Pseudodesulfovibrio hydrargyri]|uniref:Putative HTH-type transcriptional regulator n=1 Tax=Pseudodesulfovibrio hydrargyri TaxID=2125990 RepID=A0A1J5MVB2_9BACT|nr:TetR/AcrR family transcriptional regulator [Pseudodesulfovibrio hydrargyri]OIQ49882.1 putative HTH-type transcriptional regulator [Pseudodesulfovibrio hydrargyri]